MPTATFHDYVTPTDRKAVKALVAAGGAIAKTPRKTYTLEAPGRVRVNYLERGEYGGMCSKSYLVHYTHVEG